MLAKRTTYPECLRAFEWAEKYFNVHTLPWGILPGNHDDEEGITTYFSLEDVIDQLGYVRALEVISYRANVERDAESRALLIGLVLEAAEIRARTCDDFNADLCIYKKIKSGFKDVNQMKDMLTTLESISRYVHFPLLFRSYISATALLRILTGEEWASRTKNVIEKVGEEDIIRNILSDYNLTEGMVTKFTEVFKRGYCESGSHVVDVD